MIAVGIRVSTAPGSNVRGIRVIQMHRNKVAWGINMLIGVPVSDQEQEFLIFIIK